MESCDITQYLVESIQQIIGMARVGSKRLIAQKTTLNILFFHPYQSSLKSQKTFHFNITVIRSL